MTPRQVERELQRQKVLFEERITSGQFLPANVKFQEFADRWMTEYSAKQHKAKTQEANRAALERINAGIGHIRLDRLQPHHILAFLNQLEEPGQNKRTGAGLSSKTIQNIYRVISSILSTATTWGIIAHNPAQRVKPPKVQRKEAKSLDDEQTMRLLVALRSAPIKYRTAIEVLIFTGARRGEMLGLIWDDVDFDNCTLNISKASLYLPDRGIYEDTPKNDGSRRVIKLPRTVIDTLRTYRAYQAEEQLKCGDQWRGMGHIFTQWDGSPMHPDTLTGWFCKFVQRENAVIDKRNDLAEDEKATLRFPAISPHSLRHTNASLLIASGANIRTVAARLGHAQTSTTTNIYSHAIKTADAIASDALEAVLMAKQG
ncbi:MAG: site-specific integrase [Oscillospiraceae bacterium]|nr:site-specific integrase [Oscillospiraceae bacterium]